MENYPNYNGHGGSYNNYNYGNYGGHHGSNQKEKLSQKKLIQKTEQQQITDVIGMLFAEYERLEEANGVTGKRSGFKAYDNVSKNEVSSLLKAKLCMNIENAYTMMILYKKNHGEEFPVPEIKKAEKWFKDRSEPLDPDMKNILQNICNIFKRKPFENFELKEKINATAMVNEESMDFMVKATEIGRNKTENIQKEIIENPDKPIGFRDSSEQYGADGRPIKQVKEGKEKFDDKPNKHSSHKDDKMISEEDEKRKKYQPGFNQEYDQYGRYKHLK